VDGGAGLGGMLARSGVLPLSGGWDTSAVLLWPVPVALSLLPIQPVGSTQSGMLEQAPSTDASKTGAAKRVSVFALGLKFLNMVPPIEAGAGPVPAGAPYNGSDSRFQADQPRSRSEAAAHDRLAPVRLPSRNPAAIKRALSKGLK
jgi:hypothetical protein